MADTNIPETPAPRRRAPGWPAIVAALVGVIALSLWGYRAGWFDIFSNLAGLRALARGWGAWGPLGIILLNAAQTLLAPIPGQALNLVSGYLFGPWLGTLYSLAGMLLGSLIMLALVRRGGRPLAERLAGKDNLARFDAYASRRGALFLFLIFLLPFLPDDLACLAAGLTPLPIPLILVLLLVGRTPGLFVANWIGYSAAGLAPWQWAVFGVVIAALALLFWRFQPAIERQMWRLARGRF
jgi:uncharacterized membrane protein YdjX (TVP38/TMEM64 family)